MTDLAPVGSWLALLSALLAGPIGLALAALIRAIAKSVNDNNRGQNQMLEGLRADMDQVLSKAGLESIAPKPPPQPRLKRRTGGPRWPTPLPFFPPDIKKPGG